MESVTGALKAISKQWRNEDRAPNLQAYETFVKNFRWRDACDLLTGLPNGKGVNIAYEAVDRHAAGPRRNHVAIRFLSKDGAHREFTYGDLFEQTNQFAHGLTSLGVKKGDRVYCLSGRIPELYIAAIGTLKSRAVFCPLFSAFGPEPIKQRITIGEAKVLVTTERLYRRKIESIASDLPTLEHVILIGASISSIGSRVKVHAWNDLLSAASSDYTIECTNPEDPALLHFTSGTTGTPKGALHVHRVSDGHRGALFLAELDGLLQHPEDL